MRRPWPWASRWTVEPGLGGHLAVGDDLAHARAEDLGAAAGHGVVAGGAQCAAGPRRASTLEMRAMKSTSTAVSAVSETCGSRGLELGEELLVVREVVLLGHAADDVQLGDAELGELQARSTSWSTL